MNKKPRIGLFSLTSCEGCMLQLFQGEERFLELIKHVELVTSRLIKGMPGKGKLDIAIIEGSVNSKKDELKLKNHRKNANYVISLGACAGSGCVQAMRNALPEKMQRQLRKRGKVNAGRDVGKIGDFITVDYYMRGCPIDVDEFYGAITRLLHGAKPRQIGAPVCKECKENETACLLLQGKPCLGPITYGGCNAVCPGGGGYCNGCRGFTKDANIGELKRLLKGNGLGKRELGQLFGVYNTFGGENA